MTFPPSKNFLLIALIGVSILAVAAFSFLLQDAAETSVSGMFNSKTNISADAGLERRGQSLSTGGDAVEALTAQDSQPHDSRRVPDSEISRSSGTGEVSLFVDGLIPEHATGSTASSREKTAALTSSSPNDPKFAQRTKSTFALERGNASLVPLETPDDSGSTAYLVAPSSKPSRSPKARRSSENSHGPVEYSSIVGMQGGTPADRRTNAHIAAGVEHEPKRSQTSNAIRAKRSPLAKDQFSIVEKNSLKSVMDEPVSTFSVDVDSASYSYVRSELVEGVLPRPDAIRPEEMINYFNYDYPLPDKADQPFSTNVSVVETPWNPHTKILQIGLQGYSVPLESLAAKNLVFLIDTSGSMSEPNKLSLIKKALRLLISTLRPDDTIAIVTYSLEATVALQPTRASDTKAITKAVNAMSPRGRTAGHAGLQMAYALASEMQEEGGETRVILATDGDFNVGLSDIQSLKRYISDKRQAGIFLSVLGFGHGNYNDALMQTLAQNGNGIAAYIDSYSEARKVLVEQIAGSISTIAQDVKIQVEFNPATVAEYRLIGYETRLLEREDFNNDSVDAGDIGAGHTVTALYEVTPVGSPAIRLEELRYQAPPELQTPDQEAPFAKELAFVKLRYKLPGKAVSNLVTTPVKLTSSDVPESETLFAAAVAGFGQLLQKSDYLGNWSAKDLQDLAKANLGPDGNGYRSEFLSLVRLAAIADH
ncbi:magnesium chelatase subunit D [Roseibium album]|nr:magnesium chelatase subunit D [Roseibium album]